MRIGVGRIELGRPRELRHRVEEQVAGLLRVARERRGERRRPPVVGERLDVVGIALEDLGVDRRRLRRVFEAERPRLGEQHLELVARIEPGQLLAGEPLARRPGDEPAETAGDRQHDDGRRRGTGASSPTSRVVAADRPSSIERSTVAARTV